MAWIVWLVITIALIVIEILTTELVAVWFAAASAILTIVSAIFPQLGVVWQVLIFVVISAASLLATRKAVKKFTARKKGQETNLELVVGHTGMVVEDIQNDLEKGSVKINGLIWNARSIGGEQISRDELVTVKEIQGNKLFVVKKEK